MFISLAVVEMGEEDREIAVGVENEVGIRDLKWGECHAGGVGRRRSGGGRCREGELGRKEGGEGEGELRPNNNYMILWD